MVSELRARIVSHVVAQQWLAYHGALVKGTDVDKSSGALPRAWQAPGCAY